MDISVTLLQVAGMILVDVCVLVLQQLIGATEVKETIGKLAVLRVLLPHSPPIRERGYQPPRPNEHGHPLEVQLQWGPL